MDDAQVTFTLSHVAPDEDRIKVYLPPSERDAFVEFMRTEGYEPSEMFEFAFGVDDVILAFVALGGFGGLAAVLGKYFSRHQHKKVVVRAGDTEVEVSGMGPDEMEIALGNVLKEVQAGQDRDNQSWQRIVREMPDPPQQLTRGEAPCELSAPPDPPSEQDPDPGTS